MIEASSFFAGMTIDIFVFLRTLSQKYTTILRIMPKFLVSIVITTRNSASTIGELLKSIKVQDYSRIEIIVVDNKSSDGTGEIAAQYTKKVFDKGPERSAQRNFGARKAKGQYLFFLDSD